MRKKGDSRSLINVLMISDVMIVIMTGNFSDNFASILVGDAKIGSSCSISPHRVGSSGESGTRVDVKSQDELSSGLGISKLRGKPVELILTFSSPCRCNIDKIVVEGV